MVYVDPTGHFLDFINEKLGDFADWWGDLNNNFNAFIDDNSRRFRDFCDEINLNVNAEVSHDIEFGGGGSAYGDNNTHGSHGGNSGTSYDNPYADTVITVTYRIEASSFERVPNYLRGIVDEKYFSDSYVYLQSYDLDLRSVRKGPIWIMSMREHFRMTHPYSRSFGEFLVEDISGAFMNPELWKASKYAGMMYVGAHTFSFAKGAAIYGLAYSAPAFASTMESLYVNGMVAAGSLQSQRIITYSMDFIESAMPGTPKLTTIPGIDGAFAGQIKDMIDW